MYGKHASRLAFGVAALALSSPSLGQTAPIDAHYGTFGIDLTAADKTVKPGDDFWAFANGSWNKVATFTADRPVAGVTLTLVDQAEKQVRAILDDAMRDPASVGQGARKYGDLYASFLDEAAIEGAGVAPLKPYFAEIDAASDRRALQTLFSTPGYASLLKIDQFPDPNDPTRYAVSVEQGTLGMGGRDYYLEQGSKYDAFRAAYRAYVEKMLTLSGVPDGAAKADRVVALETAMAKVQWSPAQSRDVKTMYKPMDPATRKALAPEFDWPLLLSVSGYGDYPTIYMMNSTALTGLGKLFAATPVSTWQDWLKFRFVSANADTLPKVLDQAKFEFFDKTLRDQQQQGARWKRGIEMVNDTMGDAVGQIYVKRHYPSESEAKMGELVTDLRTAFEDRVKANKWMDASTRSRALAKLAAFDPRIGHPDKYTDYTALKVVRGDPLGNTIRAAEFKRKLDLSRFDKPVDRALWPVVPQNVDAGYDFQSNRMIFAAGILQPPFFDPKADAAVNYGAIGAVIGHEMGHGFDDQGSQFGPSGKLENWWTSAARATFTQRTAALSKQFDAYEPLPGMHVKGALTLGENIGDLGGLEVAYAAYQKYQADHGKAPIIAGLTGDQRFFRAYAQAHQFKMREGLLRASLMTNPHSPSYYRVNGIVRNVDAWYTAFNVKPGDALYLPPAQRVRIW